MELKSYQQAGVDWQHEKGRSMLAWRMGTGKTAATATALQQALDGCLIKKALIVAPPLVAADTWPGELQKWPHLRHLSFAVLDGPNWRHIAKTDNSDIHLISYNKLQSITRRVKHSTSVKTTPGLVDVFGRHWPYQWVVLDESARVKSAGSGRFKALRKAVKLYSHITELSGIPAPRTIEDLWSQIYLLDRGKRLYEYITHFRSRWFKKSFEHGYEPLEGASDSIIERVSDLMFSLDSSDVTELPPLVNNFIRVRLPSEAQEVYKGLEAKVLSEILGAELEPLSAANAVNKCQQLANGAVYVKPDGDAPRETKELHDRKLDALESVLVESAGEPQLVAYKFQSDLERIKKRFPFAVDVSESKDMIKRWNNGEIPLMTINPAGKAEGINLQYGGRSITFFSLTWNFSDYAQVIERLGPTRQAQSGLNRTVYVNHIVAENTVDEDILETIEARESLADLIRRRTKKAF